MRYFTEWNLSKVCFTSLCDWFGKLAPLFQPMKSKTKTKVFLSLAPSCADQFRVLIGSLGNFCLFGLGTCSSTVLGSHCFGFGITTLN